MKRKLLILLFAFLVALYPTVVAADMENNQKPAVISDSDNELLYDNSANFNVKAKKKLFGAIPTTQTDSCAGFISNEKNQAYIDRMMKWYLENNSELEQTIKNGQPIVMFFEGGSDNVDTPRHAGDASYRDAAVCIVLKYDSANQKPYIAYYCENCNTMPDYPCDVSYDNGHDCYGSATAIDGIYTIYNINHKNVYAGFNVRVGSSSCVPCVYRRDDGSFALLNGTGINIHTRMMDHISDDPVQPTSAGCILVGDCVPFDDYRSFLETTVGEQCDYTETDYNGYPIYIYGNEPRIKMGMVVIDRYLYKQRMNEIYKSNEMVEYITAFSTSCQADSGNMLSGCKSYPSYLDASVEENTPVLGMPYSSADVLGTSGTTLTATALYDTGEGGFWYRVLYNGGIGYIPASAVLNVNMRYDDLSIHNENWPEVKTYGNAFSVTGILGSVYNRYTSVTGYIKNSSGEVESSSSANGNMFSYSINASDGATDYSSSIDNRLAFSGLALGEHRYQLTGTVKNYYVENGELNFETHTKLFVDKPFKVVEISAFADGDGNWTRGSEEGLVFGCNISSARFKSVKVDGNDVSSDGYSFDSTAVLVTLNPEYLQTLELGKHILTVVTKYGDADVEFTVLCPHDNTELRDAKDATKTEKGYTGDIYCIDCGEKLQEGTEIEMLPGDDDPEVTKTWDNSNVRLWIAVLAVSGFVVCLFCLCARRKNEKIK